MGQQGKEHERHGGKWRQRSRAVRNAAEQTIGTKQNKKKKTRSVGNINAGDTGDVGNGDRESSASS
jgi:hypothetical protein